MFSELKSQGNERDNSEVTHTPYFPSTHIKNKVGNVHPEWFMSDDASQYYKYWSQAFKRQPKRLLCIWQVDRARRNAISRINEQELQISVYHTLRVLVQQNMETFHTLMDGAIKQWQGNPKLEFFTNTFPINTCIDLLNGPNHTGEKLVSVLTCLCNHFIGY